MSNQTKIPLIIVGGGIAGAAAALRACQYHINTLWIMGNNKTAKRSRSKWVANIDNMIGIHPDIVLDKLKKRWKKMPDLLAKLDELPAMLISTSDIIQNSIKRITEYGDFVQIKKTFVNDAKKNREIFTLQTSDDNSYSCQHLIIATGLMDRQPTIFKEPAGPKWIFPFANAESVLYCIRCEGHLSKNKKVVVIGHSEVAGQVACMLFERYQSTTHLLTNGEISSFSNETEKLLNKYAILIRTEKIIDLQQRTDSKEKKLSKIILADGNVVETDYALVSLGIFAVYNQLALQLGAKPVTDETPIGQTRIRVKRSAETDQENLFCIGDMAQREDDPIMMQIYTAQEYAVRAVDTIDKRIRVFNRQK